MTRLRSLSSISVCVLGVVATGLGVGCSSNRRSGRAEAQDEIALTGSLGLALTARGESGALYRLRDATFSGQRSSFTFFTPALHGERSHGFDAGDVDARRRLRHHAVPGFLPRTRRARRGHRTRARARFISPSTQSFQIDANEQTNVSYVFETNGEIVEFGQGRLVVDIQVSERAGQTRRTVIETNQEALSSVTLRGTLDASLGNAGISNVGAVDVYHALIDSYNAAPGRERALRHCDDQRTSGEASLNGFPLACPRLEGQLFDNLDSWFPLAFVNRLDLAPTDGSNCGQQRLIFANNDGGRMFIIVEAQIPNPSPECGVSACLPLAEFWDSLATVDNPRERGQRLADAFLTSGAGPIGPFMNRATWGRREAESARTTSTTFSGRCGNSSCSPRRGCCPCRCPSAKHQTVCCGMTRRRSPARRSAGRASSTRSPTC